MIVIGSNTSDNGQSRFTEDVSHFMELWQNRQLALLKRSAKNLWLTLFHVEQHNLLDKTNQLTEQKPEDST